MEQSIPEWRKHHSTGSAQHYDSDRAQSWGTEDFPYSHHRTNQEQNKLGNEKDGLSHSHPIVQITFHARQGLRGNSHRAPHLDSLRSLLNHVRDTSGLDPAKMKEQRH